jgi:hypothetical protein
MLRCIFKNISKYAIKISQNVLLVPKLFLNNGYKSLTVLIMIFLLIRLIPNFNDMYVMYSQ